MSMNHAHRAILGNTKVAAPLSKTAPRASNAAGFFRGTEKIPNLPLIAADCAALKADIINEEEEHKRDTERNTIRPLKRGRSKLCSRRIS